MKFPYGLPAIEDCSNCPLRNGKYACNFSDELRKEFDAVSYSVAYPEGAVLTVEGQPSNGVFLICYGQLKLTSTSREGKSVILRIARAGEFVGLSAAISGEIQNASAETTTPTLVRFINKQDFARLMQKFPSLAMEVARSLSSEYTAACREIRALALAPSTAGRLASLLVSWCPPQCPNTHSEVRIKSAFTHEEIGAMIGTTRETVSRIFSDFKRHGIVNVNGATLVVRDMQALEAMAV